MSHSLRSIGLAALACATLLLAGCNSGGHTRGMFNGYVVGKTEAEIVDRFGKPVNIDRSDPEAPVIVYKEKTFDTDNGNRTDPETLIMLSKKDGKLVATDVSFRG